MNRRQKIDKIKAAIGDSVEYDVVYMPSCSRQYEEFDEELKADIEKRIDEDDIMAWCLVRVTASYGAIQGIQYLDCCSYEDEKSFLSCGYYSDMKDATLEEICEQILQHHELAIEILN